MPVRYLISFYAALLALHLFPAAAYAACTGPAGAEGEFMYNTDYGVPQICTGREWVALGRVNPGAGSSGCTGPDGTEGELMYNYNYHVPQYCDGDDWVVMIGNSGGLYTFTDLTDQPPATLITSNIQQVHVVVSSAVSIAGDGSPEYRICADDTCAVESQTWTNTPGTINDGEFLQLRLTTGGGSTTSAAIVTVGNVGDQWNVSTPGDYTPDAFSFTDQTGVALSTLIESDIVQITGISEPIDTSISGGGSPEYRICADATCSSVLQAWTSDPATMQNGEYLQLRLTSSASGDTMLSATMTVGTESDQWDVTTSTDDAPDAFSFTDQTDVTTPTLITSNIVHITGISAPVATGVSGQGSPEYRTCSDSGCSSEIQTWTSGAASIDDGQYLQLRLTSSASFGVEFIATMTVGAAAEDWSVSTGSQDTTPDAFSFTDQTAISLSTLTQSNIIQITGITGAVATGVSVSNETPRVPPS